MKKTLVATVFIMFALVATYIPQDWNRIELAHAGAAGGGATEPTQILNNIQLVGVNMWTAISAAADPITAWATGSEWVKDNLLDGIGWKIAKFIVSSMIKSLVNWINSGFKGSPLFIQDFGAFLRNAADEAIGQYISELGGLGSFVCSPFKLDIQIAVALEYQGLRKGGAPKCTLSGIINNIQNFVGGSVGSFDQGGWNDWFDITAQPSVYTPYGAELAAKTEAYVRIVNARGEEAAKVDWGGGFLSGELCEPVVGPDGPNEECWITKPGKIIQEALSFNLDSGRQSLVAADEINEIIAALLGQVAQAALSGAAGLLGLSGGTGYTYSGFSGGSYLGEMTEQSFGSNGITDLIDARQVQVDYQNLATTYRPLLLARSVDPKAKAQEQTSAASEAAFALTIIGNTTANIVAIDALITKYNATTSDMTTKSDVLIAFSNLSLYTQSDINISRTTWDTILN